MKLMLGLLALLVVGGAATYYLGGYASYDPTQQGRDARKAITPGMTWQQVIDVSKEPRKYRLMMKKAERFGGEEVARLEPGPLSGFNASRFTGKTPNGFIFEYRYSQREAFAVHFNADGIAESVSDLITKADLLKTR